MSYQGGFWDLLRITSHYCNGLVSFWRWLSRKGAAFLQMKTAGDLNNARSDHMYGSCHCRTLLLLAGYAYTLPGYLITSPVVTDGVFKLHAENMCDDLMTCYITLRKLPWSHAGSVPLSGYHRNAELCSDDSWLKQRTGLAFASSSLSMANILNDSGRCAYSQWSCRLTQYLRIVFNTSLRTEHRVS